MLFDTACEQKVTVSHKSLISSENDSLHPAFYVNPFHLNAQEMQEVGLENMEREKGETEWHQALRVRLHLVTHSRWIQLYLWSVVIKMT